MNRATKIIELPALTVDLLKANGVCAITSSLVSGLSRAGINKRPCIPMSKVIFGLMAGLWLKKESIGTMRGQAVESNIG